MSGMTLQEMAKKVGDIDFTMFSTVTEGGAVSSRPMSNNGDVEYDGDSYFFSWDSARTIADIKRSPKVGLTLQGKGGLLGKPPLFIAIEATAELIYDKAAFAEHWTKDLDRWFEQRVDTPGIVLIKAHADRITYWDGEEEGDVKV